MKMLFGPKRAPIHFQQIVDKVAQGVNKFTRTYIDNFLVHSTMVKKHIEHFNMMIKAIMKAELRLNQKKCKIGCSQIKFIGNMINGESHIMD
jgi:uncharacterized protein YbcC (UPF0753/DUF2309 family)